VARIEKAVMQWYRNEALRVFEECVEYFAPQLQVSPCEIKLSAARTQWGSCTVRGVVRLNWQLVKMPLHLIDYVVVHELAHLVEMNHSPAFWSVVERACPEYRKCRAELRSYGVAE
jgi:predicted metal-dependent hydrolase